MLTLFRSRFRLIAVPVAAGGALVALAIGVGAGPSTLLASAAASTPARCPAAAGHAGAKHASRQSCVNSAALIAKAQAVKVPTMKNPTTVRNKFPKPAQSSGTPADRQRWQRVQAALAGRAA